MPVLVCRNNAIAIPYCHVRNLYIGLILAIPKFTSFLEEYFIYLYNYIENSNSCITTLLLTV